MRYVTFLFLLILIINFASASVPCSGLNILERGDGSFLASQLNCAHRGSCEEVLALIFQGRAQVTTLNCVDSQGNSHMYFDGRDVGPKLDEPKEVNITIFGFSLIEVSLFGGITFVGVTIYFLWKRSQKVKK